MSVKVLTEQAKFLLIPADDHTGSCTYWGTKYPEHKILDHCQECVQCHQIIDWDFADYETEEEE